MSDTGRPTLGPDEGYNDYIVRLIRWKATHRDNQFVHELAPYEGDGDPGCTDRCPACYVGTLEEMFRLERLQVKYLRAELVTLKNRFAVLESELAAWRRGPRDAIDM